MTSTDTVYICEPEVARHDYETLRAHALGDINRAPDFMLFLRHGMRAWLRTLQGRGDVRRETGRPETSSVFAGPQVNIPWSGLASILTDTILNGTSSAVHSGGNT
jgi:hypothetical protein